MSHIIAIVIDEPAVNFSISEGLPPQVALAAARAVVEKLEGQVVEARARAMLAAMKAEEEEGDGNLEETAREPI